MSLLLENGADVNSRNYCGQVCDSYVFFSSRFCLDCMTDHQKQGILGFSLFVPNLLMNFGYPLFLFLVVCNGIISNVGIAKITLL